MCPLAVRDTRALPHGAPHTFWNVPLSSDPLLTGSFHAGTLPLFVLVLTERHPALTLSVPGPTLLLFVQLCLLLPAQRDSTCW